MSKVSIWQYFKQCHIFSLIFAVKFGKNGEYGFCRDSNFMSSPFFRFSILEHLDEFALITLYIVEHVGHGAIPGRRGNTRAIYSGSGAGSSHHVCRIMFLPCSFCQCFLSWTVWVFAKFRKLFLYFFSYLRGSTFAIHFEVL